jgi:O-antigen/teichoic acid export membrane protein
MARVFNQGSTLAINVILANLLGRHAFGEYSIIYSTILTISTISTLGVGSSATKYIAEFRLVDKKRTAHVLGLCSATAGATAWISGGLLLLLAPWICTDVLTAPHLTPGLRIASGVVLFVVLNSYITGALIGLESFSALALASACGAVAQILSATTGARLAGVNGAVAGLVLGGICQWVALWFLFRRERIGQSLCVTYQGLRSEWPLIQKYFIPAALSGFVSMPALWLANAFLVRLPDGFNQLALYSVASNIRICILFVPQIVNGVGVSLINTQAGLGAEHEYRRTFWLNLVLTALSAFLGAMAAMLLATHLLSFFGKGFVEGRATLTILSLSAVIEACATATYQVVQSRAEMWRSLLLICVPRDILVLTLAYTLAPGYGAVGVAWAYAVGTVVSLATTGLLTWQLGVRPAGSCILSSKPV